MKRSIIDNKRIILKTFWENEKKYRDIKPAASPGADVL
jgi:hypothetical protein